MIDRFDKKHIGIFVLVLGVLLLSSSIGFALNSPFDAVAKAFGGRSLGDVYNSAPGFFDSLLLAIIFISIGMIGLKRFADTRAGTAMIIAIGIALTIGTELYFRSVGIGIADLGEIGVILLLLIAGVGAQRLLHQKMGMAQFTAGMLSFIVIYSILRFILGPALDRLRGIGLIGLLIGILDIAAVVLSILVIIRAARYLGVLGAGGVAREVVGARNDAREIQEEISELQRNAAAGENTANNQRRILGEVRDARSRLTTDIGSGSIPEDRAAEARRLDNELNAVEYILNDPNAAKGHVTKTLEDLQKVMDRYHEFYESIAEANVAEEVQNLSNQAIAQDQATDQTEKEIDIAGVDLERANATEQAVEPAIDQALNAADVAAERASTANNNAEAMQELSRMSQELENARGEIAKLQQNATLQEASATKIEELEDRLAAQEQVKRKTQRRRAKKQTQAGNTKGAAQSKQAAKNTRGVRRKARTGKKEASKAKKAAKEVKKNAIDILGAIKSAKNYMKLIRDPKQSPKDKDAAKKKLRGSFSIILGRKKEISTAENTIRNAWDRIRDIEVEVKNVDKITKSIDMAIGQELMTKKRNK